MQFKRNAIVLMVLTALLLLAVSSVNATGENNTYIKSDSAHQTDSGDSKLKITLQPEKLSTTYQSGKYFKVKAVDSDTKKPLSNIGLLLKVYTSGKFKKISLSTDSKGVAKYSTSNLKTGTHKISVMVKDSGVVLKAKNSVVKISKAKLSLKAPKVTNPYKANKYFKVTVKNKQTGNVMKNIKVMLKVFDKSKFKKYSLKTDKNGVVKITTKGLSKMTHKVLVSVAKTSDVKSASLKSTIKITDSSRSVKLKVNGNTFTVKLEDNEASRELYERLKKGDITVHAEEYGNFEKVGNLGFSLPRSDKEITTSPGDLVLYRGNEISLFYDSNSWQYTKLGKIQNVNTAKLKSVLGSGDVEFTLSLK